MNQAFDIAGLPGQSPGLRPGGSGSAPGGAQAPQGLFSSLVSLMNGGQPGTKISDLVQVGSPDRSGQAWLNLQAGDVSLSLSAQALTNAITPGEGLELAADLADQLNLDELVLAGLNGLTQGQSPVPPQPAPLPALRAGEMAQGIQLAAMQETGAQQAQNQTTTGSGTTSDTPDTASSRSSEQALLAMSRVAGGAPGPDIVELLALQGQNPASKVTTGSDPLTIASTLNANAPKQSGQAAAAPTSLTGLSAEQLSANTQTASRDSLAAQLQRQLSGNGERTAGQNSQNNMAGNAAGGTPSAQGTGGINATLTTLPFVQTRQIVTTEDPAALAQLTAQNTGRAEQGAMFRPVQAAYQPPQINYPGMAVEIARNFNAGINQFKIRLDPPELGRIDVRMHVDDKGAVNARLSVERAETLDLLLRDARALERALTQAGLDGARTNLEFSLKQNPFGAGQESQERQPGNSRPDGADTSDTPETEPVIAAYQGTLRPGGISLWA